MTVRELYQKFKALSTEFANVNASPEISNAIRNTEEWLVELNREQLSMGIDSKGVKLMRYSSVPYAIQKEKMNPKPGFLVPDLKYRGDFYDGFFAKLQNKKIIFGSTDYKSDMLKAKYDNDIFGLTKENEDYYKSNILKEEILKIVERRTGIKIK